MAQGSGVDTLRKVWHSEADQVTSDTFSARAYSVALFRRLRLVSRPTYTSMTHEWLHRQTLYSRATRPETTA